MIKYNKLLSSFALCALLIGCSDDPENNGADETEGDITAVIVGATADFTTATHAVLETSAPYVAQTEINASDKTDVIISSYKNYFYKIERFNANNITRYDIASPAEPIWQCSTEGDETQSNPYQLIQVSDDKAYVLRYGSAKLWIVDPSIIDSSKCEDEFKTGEIDLALFDDDGIPDMSSAVVVGNRLFITIQKLTFFSPVLDAQVVVIDTSTDQIIDTDSTGNGTQAITLNGKNPGYITYSAELDLLFIQSVGRYDGSSFGGLPVEYSGGIDTIDPTTFEVEQLIDDTASTTKQISAMSLINSETAYLLGYEGFANNTLYQFNPASGVFNTDKNDNLQAIAGLANQNITGIYAGPDNTLWIAIDSGIAILDTATNQLLETLLDTKMNPSGVAFVGQ